MAATDASRSRAVAFVSKAAVGGRTRPAIVLKDNRRVHSATAQRRVLSHLEVEDLPTLIRSALVVSTELLAVHRQGARDAIGQQFSSIIDVVVYVDPRTVGRQSVRQTTEISLVPLQPFTARGGINRSSPATTSAETMELRASVSPPANLVWRVEG